MVIDEGMIFDGGVILIETSEMLVLELMTNLDDIGLYDTRLIEGGDTLETSDDSIFDDS